MSALVYLILGSAGSGRREVIGDLIDGGLSEGDHPAVIFSEAEAGKEEYAWKSAGDHSIEAEVPEEATHVFFVTDGRKNPVDQVEAFKAWIAGRPMELGRVLTVVDCRLAEKEPALLAWFDACIHFSDVVLLNHREGVANKWLSGFLGHFKKQFVPCLFEMVKAGRVANPALVLVPQARRVSQIFDEGAEWADAEDEGDEDELEGEEEIELAPAEDPYLARRAGGRRLKEIPDIAKYLP